MSSPESDHIYITPFQIYGSQTIWYRSLCELDKSEKQYLNQDGISCQHCKDVLERDGAKAILMRAQMKRAVASSCQKWQIPIVYKTRFG